MTPNKPRALRTRSLLGCLDTMPHLCNLPHPAGAASRAGRCKRRYQSGSCTSSREIHSRASLRGIHPNLQGRERKGVEVTMPSQPLCGLGTARAQLSGIQRQRLVTWSDPDIHLRPESSLQSGLLGPDRFLLGLKLGAVQDPHLCTSAGRPSGCIQMGRCSHTSPGC